MTKRVLIFGCGKRVREAALPALRRLGSRFEIRGIVARSAREIEVDGETHAVRAIDGLTRADLEGVDLCYVAVTKDAVPPVLSRLAGLDPSAVDLLIDTPVVRFRHFRHAARVSAFRNAWVAEDCVELPWLDTVGEAVAQGVLGELESVTFHQSAYAYHGVATAKALLGPAHVRRGRRRKVDGRSRREIGLSNGREALVIEPRDYAIGHLEIVGSKLTISDRPTPPDGGLRIEPTISDGTCTGFRIGDVTTALDDGESDLCRGSADDASVTARMEAMKRVGFLRLLCGIDEGRGAYPIDDALEDMVVDYHLEKLGRYRANPFTSPRSPLGRVLLRTLTRFGG